MYSVFLAARSALGNTRRRIAFALERSMSHRASNRRPQQKQLDGRRWQKLRGRLIWERVWCWWLAATVLVNLVSLLDGFGEKRDTEYTHRLSGDTKRCREIPSTDLEEFVQTKTQEWQAGGGMEFNVVTSKEGESEELNEEKQRITVWNAGMAFKGNEKGLLLVTSDQMMAENRDSGYEKKLMKEVAYTIPHLKKTHKLGRNAWVVGRNVPIDGTRWGWFGLYITPDREIVLTPQVLEVGRVDAGDRNHVEMREQKKMLRLSEAIILKVVLVAKQLVAKALKDTGKSTPKAMWEEVCQPIHHIVSESKELCLKIQYEEAVTVRVRGPLLHLVYIKSIFMMDKLKECLLEKHRSTSSTSDPHVEISPHLYASHKLPDTDYKLEASLEFKS